VIYRPFVFSSNNIFVIINKDKGVIAIGAGFITLVRMVIRVLLVGHGLYCEGLKHILADDPHVAVVGSARTRQEAQNSIKQLAPEVVIIDRTASEFSEDDLTLLLAGKSTNLLAVYLNLDENKMIVHDRHLVGSATFEDLLAALHTHVLNEES
jgi:DNA-binding NarL/FixJ family response regulator